MKLSILICSLENRKDQLQHLLEEIKKQCTIYGVHGEVEVLVEVDNKQISTGAKRNILLNRAIGDYIVFIDDDDHILPGYVRLILEALTSDPDCVATTGYYSQDNGHKYRWKLSKDFINYDENENGELILFRKTNHISPVKRGLALQTMFPDISNAEDKDYSDRLNSLLKTETIIDIPIYHYDYSSTDKSYS